MQDFVNRKSKKGVRMRSAGKRAVAQADARVKCAGERTGVRGGRMRGAYTGERTSVPVGHAGERTGARVAARVFARTRSLSQIFLRIWD